MSYKDHESDELGVGPLPSLTGDDVPFLGRTHDHLCGLDLLLVQLVIARQLLHIKAIWTQSLQNVPPINIIIMGKVSGGLRPCQ